MAKLKLTIAFDKYDYLQPLRDGQIEVEGIDLNVITVESGIRHERMFHYGEYDACEFSMSSYLVARGQDIDWLQAIPFFPRRMWGTAALAQSQDPRTLTAIALSNSSTVISQNGPFQTVMK